MDENCPKNRKFLSLCIIATFCCVLFVGTDAQAFVYCVGCNEGTAATCTGGDDCNVGGNCDSGTNSVVCNDIAEALTCIDALDDTNATIRVAQGMHTGPGSSSPIDNSAGAAQTISILGGWTANTCVTQTLNPTNTIVQAPVNDRVFTIDNTMTDPLIVSLQGLTITGGDPSTSCNGAGTNDGGGVCATSSGGTGGLMFTSISNIYDENQAVNGGGVRVFTDGGGNINTTIMDDTFSNNSSDQQGGALAFGSTSNKTLTVSMSGNVIGGNLPFPLGGNEAGLDGGGVFIFAEDGFLNLSSEGNVITHNTASTGEGGGVRIFTSDTGAPVQPVMASFEGDEIIFNEATSYGGGLGIDADPDSSANVSISKTKIGSNTAGTFGGGIGLSGDGIINLDPVVNTIIFDNIANGSPGGGAVAARTTGNSSNFILKFVNNTISDNQTSNDGGAILASSMGNDGTIDWTFLNEIIFFNSSGGLGDQVALVNTGDNATLSIRFSDIPQGPSDISGAGGPGEGFINLAQNISNDPLFEDRFTFDYHLQAQSPAGNAGTKPGGSNTFAGEEAQAPPDDFDGVLRDISMGAFEPNPTPTPAVTPTPTPIPCTTNDNCPDGDICGDMDVCTPGCTEDHPCPPDEVCEDIDQDTGIGMCVMATPTPSPTPSPSPTPTPTPTPTPPPIPTPTPTPANIVTFPNAKNGKLVTIESEEGTVLSDVKPLSKNLKGCPEGFDGQFLSFPEGSYQYVVSGINPGDDTTVLIDLPPGTVLNSYFKFGPTPDNPQPHCYEFLFDGQTGAQISATTVVVHHVDGARGDDDLTANGVIVDPAAPALLSEEPPNVSGNGCSIAQSVSSRTALLNLLIPLLPAFAVGLRSFRRKKYR